MQTTRRPVQQNCRATSSSRAKGRFDGTLCGGHLAERCSASGDATKHPVAVTASMLCTLVLCQGLRRQKWDPERVERCDGCLGRRIRGANEAGRWLIVSRHTQCGAATIEILPGPILSGGIISACDNTLPQNTSSECNCDRNPRNSLPFFVSLPKTQSNWTNLRNCAGLWPFCS